MEETAFHDSAKLLVLLHAACSIVLIGASTHHFLIALGYLRGRAQVRLGRIYAAVVPVAYLATALCGALAYPAYRYYARALYLDRYAAWASNLFDVKENVAALGLPLVIGTFILSRVLDKPSEERAMLAGYFAMVSCTVLIVWFSVISGLLITMTRGV